MITPQTPQTAQTAQTPQTPHLTKTPHLTNLAYLNISVPLRAFLYFCVRRAFWKSSQKI